MLENYNINDYLKDDKELQKAVIQELLDDFQCAVMNVKNLLETKQRLKAELTDLEAENDKLRTCLQEIKAIVCGNYEIIDPQGRKDILKLIIKAESEG